MLYMCIHVKYTGFIHAYMCTQLYILNICSSFSTQISCYRAILCTDHITTFHHHHHLHDKTLEKATFLLQLLVTRRVQRFFFDNLLMDFHLLHCLLVSPVLWVVSWDLSTILRRVPGRGVRHWAMRSGLGQRRDRSAH